MQKNTENFQILNFISNFAVTMAGLYLHIPFCKSRCIYCNFYSTTHADMRQRYVDALCKEMEMKKPTPSQRDGRLSTIYLGGGTPSQLTIPQLHQLFYNINKVYSPTSHLSPLTSEIACYLTLSLFIVHHDPRLRKQAKLWRQSHPDCSLSLRRFLSLAKQIRC